MLQTTIQLKGLVRYTVEAWCFVVSVCPSVCLSICLSNTFLGYTFRHEFWWKDRNCKPHTCGQLHCCTWKSREGPYTCKRGNQIFFFKYGLMVDTPCLDKNFPKQMFWHWLQRRGAWGSEKGKLFEELVLRKYPIQNSEKNGVPCTLRYLLK